MNRDIEKLLIEPLDHEYDRASFQCGKEALDRYLKQQAGQDARKKVAAPYVAAQRGSKVVKGYYTLSMTAIDVVSLPHEIARKLPKYPIVPAVLLGRLAVDQSCHGSGIGSFLLVDAMRRSLRNEIAWTLIVVDAIDEMARAFYERYGFSRLSDHPMKLFIPRSEVEHAVELANRGL